MTYLKCHWKSDKYDEPYMIVKYYGPFSHTSAMAYKQLVEDQGCRGTHQIVNHVPPNHPINEIHWSNSAEQECTNT